MARNVEELVGCDKGTSQVATQQQLTCFLGGGHNNNKNNEIKMIKKEK